MRLLVFGLLICYVAATRITFMCHKTWDPEKTRVTITTGDSTMTMGLDQKNGITFAISGAERPKMEVSHDCGGTKKKSTVLLYGQTNIDLTSI
ncbi:unnamed protein product [Bursaphelenchus xylophilus]|uniref:(pine wood nematode) hypothetical protein n=1 Tax=Bursaphelenchus xylophilus TaxID=6326 RepID=A0A1I7SDW7_BURXY|nr:unnamed protein product [Bursaphelenchus xylophilus]CAG9100332.1 unnamed protein product [Bursaphelenchus xylophilus]